ncbi:reverse transcriptase domain-containing protein [Tanacetum coccineum]
MGEEEELPEPWILFTDGSSCTDGSGAGLILTNPEGIEFTYALRFRFDATNNEAEYEALIAGLKIAEQMGVKNLKANVDSRLVANQVPRSENKKADALSKIASTSFAHLSKQVLVEELKEKSISTVEVLAVAEEEEDTWITPIFKYLMDGTLPAEVKKERAVKRKSLRGLVASMLVHDPSWQKPCGLVMQERYMRGLVASMRRATPSQLCKKADKGMPGLPSSQAWPGKVKFLIVAIDYFTKFRLLGEIISDNGKQFQDNLFKNWCEKLCIHQHFASIKHPQTNGLVERENCSLGEGIKARLDERSKNWMKELPHVLWAHCIMIKSSIGDISFLLTYGTEAVIPAEIGMPTLRTAEVDLVQNNKAMEINLDLLEERREQAAIREAKSKAKMERYYNSKVRNTSFKPGDLVYRNNDASHAEDTRKLGPK